MFSKTKMIIAMIAIVLAISTCGSTMDASDPSKGFRLCPPPYKNILGECFYVHMYIPLLTWSQAETFCKQAGGILAEPTHFGAIVAQLFNSNLAGKIYNRELNRLWVGGHRTEGPNATTFQWSSGRPIDDIVEDGTDIYTSTDGGDCIMILMNRESPVHLRAASCEIRTHYICQLP